MRFLKNKTELTDQQGSAVIEFVFFGLFASTSIAFGALSLSQVQHDQYLAQLAAKQVGRALAMSADYAVLTTEVQAITESLNAQKNEIAISVECLPSCSASLAIQPGAVVQATATFRNQSSVFRIRVLR
ncbi:MAG: hypothetical protein RL556_375 [Actinomycetota bacterium]|jgi:Flp pilus assembly protein TadG